MDRLLQFLLKTFIRRGTFRVTTSRGTVLTFGDGTGQPVSVRFASRKAEWGILLDPELKFGESYMAGTFVVEDGTIADVLAIALGQKSEVPYWARIQGLLRYLWRRLSQFNPRPRARRNVAHHYDLDGRLYSLFLQARAQPDAFIATDYHDADVIHEQDQRPDKLPNDIAYFQPM